MFSFPSSTRKPIIKQRTSTDVKVCFQQLVRQVHVENPSLFKLSNLIKISKKFPGLESTTFKFEYIPINNNNSQRILIDSEEALAIALNSSVTSALSLKVFVVPINLTSSSSSSSFEDEIRSHNSSEFELMDYSTGSESEEGELYSDRDGEDDMSGTIVVPSEMSIVHSISDEEIKEQLEKEEENVEAIPTSSEEEKSQDAADICISVIAPSSQSMNEEGDNDDENEISRECNNESNEEKEVLASNKILDHASVVSDSPIVEQIALFDDDIENNNQNSSNENPSLGRLQEMLSSILCDPDIAKEMQHILVKKETQQFVSDVLQAERDGSDIWEAASPHSTLMTEILPEATQKSPRLRALLPVLIALALDVMTNKPTSESDNTELPSAQGEEANDDEEEANDDDSYEEIEAESDLVQRVEALNLLQCQEHHNLKGFDIIINKYVCDLCGTRPGSKQLMFGCRDCDFDICVRCAEHIAGPMVRMMKFGCPGKHELKEHVAIHSGFACNNCFIRPDPGTIMHGCRICNYDQCVACYNKSIQKCIEDSRKDATSMLSDSKQYQAICVESVTYPDGSVLSPGEVFTKIWLMKNTSKEPWPEGTRLIPVGGERFDFPLDGILISPLNPDDCGEISLRLTAPLSCNRYIVYFGLITPDGERFGDRIWVDVTINGTTGEQIIATISQPLRSISDSIKSKVHHLELRGKVSASANTILSQIPNVLNSFVANYSDNIDDDDNISISEENANQSETNETSDDIIKKYSNEIQTLVEMGFDDIEKNIQLLERYNGSVNDILAEMFQEGE